TPPTVEFRVYWDAAPDNINHLDSVWIFVDYQPISSTGTAGAWTPATLSTPATASAGTVIPVTGNTRGFYLRGTPAAGFSSTVTVELTGPVAGDKFNWCAYVSDYPPNATDNNGFYNLHGTPPFIINGSITEPTRQYSGCIDALTDATGCPGLIPAKPEITAFTPLFDTICKGETVTLTATATGASEYSFDGGTTWQAASMINVAPTTDATYIIKVRNAAGCTVTAAAVASIKVYPKPVASFSTAPSTACGGSSVTVVADGGGSYCFTHSCTACGRNPYRNGNDAPTDFDCFFRNDSCAYGTSNSYTFSMPDSGSITVCVRVINEHGCLDSACTTITVSVLPPAPILAGGGTYCANAALICDSEVGYSYQLQDGFLQDAGAIQTGAGAPLNFPITVIGTYTVVVTDPVTNCTVVSNAQEVSFYSALAAGSITTVSHISCNNTADTAIAEATAPSFGDGNYSYQWTVSYNGGATAVIAGATNATYALPATATAGTYIYNRQVTDGCAAEFIASGGTFTREVYEAFDAGSISGSGSNDCAKIAEGIPASGASGTHTYRWVRDTPAETYSVNSASYTFSIAELSVAGVYTYYREVHDNTCNTDVWSRSGGSYVLTVPAGCPYTGADLYQDATHLCQRRSSGAENWEAYVKDSRDNKVYRIIQMPDCHWYFGQKLDYRDGAYDFCYQNNASYCDTYGVIYSVAAVTSTTDGCPTNWAVPTHAQWEGLVNSIAGGPTNWAAFWPVSGGGTDLYGFTAVQSFFYRSYVWSLEEDPIDPIGLAWRYYWGQPTCSDGILLLKREDTIVLGCFTGTAVQYGTIRCIRTF
ncbi:MAG: hypothetical protein LBS12_00930, partial [Prevotellaceae bacterium]|nr:hypothetical protein [Prevotellaceae bacterium]